MEREHPAIQPEQTIVFVQLGDRRRAADDRDRFHSLRHRPRTRVGVGRAAGNREHPKFFDPQLSPRIRSTTRGQSRSVRSVWNVDSLMPGRSGEIMPHPEYSRCRHRVSTPIVRELGQP